VNQLTTENVFPAAHGAALHGAGLITRINGLPLSFLALPVPLVRLLLLRNVSANFLPLDLSEHRAAILGHEDMTACESACASSFLLKYSSSALTMAASCIFRSSHLSQTIDSNLMDSRTRVFVDSFKRTRTECRELLEYSQRLKASPVRLAEFRSLRIVRVSIEFVLQQVRNIQGYGDVNTGVGNASGMVVVGNRLNRHAVYAPQS
jgi:hypothetical protein